MSTFESFQSTMLVCFLKAYRRSITIWKERHDVQFSTRFDLLASRKFDSTSTDIPLWDTPEVIYIYHAMCDMRKSNVKFFDHIVSKFVAQENITKCSDLLVKARERLLQCTNQHTEYMQQIYRRRKSSNDREQKDFDNNVQRVDNEIMSYSVELARQEVMLAIIMSKNMSLDDAVECGTELMSNKRNRSQQSTPTTTPDEASDTNESNKLAKHD